MSPSDDQVLRGSIFDESAILSLKDLSRMCAVDERHITQFVEEGVLSVVVIESEWRFSGGPLERNATGKIMKAQLRLRLAGA